MSTKTVLILGGIVPGTARSLATYLLTPNNAIDDIKHIRIVDRYLCIPSSDVFLTYVDSKAKSTFKDPRLEYVQANLLLKESQEKVFIRPDDPDKPYDFVFDFTGVDDYSSEDIVHVERTVKLAAGLGQAALKNGGVKAYVRLLGSEYQPRNSLKIPISEDDPEVAPWTRKQKWWHEASRTLANISELNLVLVRTGAIYGPYMITQVTGRLLIGEIYHFLREKMELLWTEGVRLNTVHSEDLNLALWKLAIWMSEQGREKADEKAKSPLPSCRPLPSWVSTYGFTKKESSEYDKPGVLTVEGVPKQTGTVYAPVFNVVDDGDTTQGKLSQVISSVIGVEWGFVGSVISQLAKMNLNQVLEDANEKHMEPWGEMLEKSNPPISNPPVNPFIPLELLSNQPLCLDNSKIKKIIGWEPVHAPTVEDTQMKEVVDLFRAENGVWPNASPRF